jgi:GxxExxY protein
MRVPENHLRQETEAIIGCAYEVHNVLGLGLSEKHYEKALCVELKIRHIPFADQVTYHVHYKNIVIGDFRPDLIIYDKVIIDMKTIPQIGELELGQMLNYLKIAELAVGLILNFRNTKLEVKRVVRPV